MKEIKLTQGYTALVDDDMYEYLSDFNWYYSTGYAMRDEYSKDKSKTILMHRLIYEIKIGEVPDGLSIDRKDRNRLNNLSENLRLATQQQNNFNRAVQSNNRHSKFKGVKFVVETGNWKARIRIDGTETTIGTFTDEIACANAYNNYAKLLFGEFAYLNDVEYMSEEELKKYQCHTYKKSKNNYKGVSFKKSKNKWIVQLYNTNKERVWLGSFKTEEEATGE
jgi:hypothetical protein